ncbi:MAG: NAD(P)/FAD-dependent oxidoreductase [Granulosicoccus sp.]
MKQCEGDIAVIGAGIIGIATAYYLKSKAPDAQVMLVDAGEPMALTSAQSGENYRNWWPHPIMTAFTDRSIDLMEELARKTGNLINMNRRGYVLATRNDDSDQLLDELESGYSQLTCNEIRIHTGNSNQTYQPPDSSSWENAPSGVDVIKDQALIKNAYPSYDKGLKTLVHVRRAGAISAQQMGQYMMQRFKLAGGLFVKARVREINKQDGYTLYTDQGDMVIKAQRIVNAAGPFIQQIAQMLSINLPVHNTLQQKIAFEDIAGAIPRTMPFSNDLDAQQIDWTDEERQLLLDSEDHRWLTKELPGAIHCRPEGGDNGTWLKLGWAFNDAPTTALRHPALMDSFPEIVLRGAARLNPSLKHYYTRMPTSMHHYGGYYTLTPENWPLIGPMNAQIEGAYVVGAMSGFGTMAACAAGDLCASVITGIDVPHYAHALSPQRYEDKPLMAEIKTLSQRGIL